LGKTELCLGVWAQGAQVRKNNIALCGELVCLRRGSHDSGARQRYIQFFFWVELSRGKVTPNALLAQSIVVCSQLDKLLSTPTGILQLGPMN
jgi:hypothetical protein